MLFMSSAITRMKGKFPPHIHADWRASVVSAEDWLIEGMRRDPEVIERGIKIHSIAPAGVVSPFHSGGEIPESRLIPINNVVNAVVKVLASNKSEDIQLIPEE